MSYRHGWGSNGADAKDVVARWTLSIADAKKKPTSISFDMVEGEEPLLIGLDVKQYCDTFNRASQTFVKFKRPCDNEERLFFTYISKDEGDNPRIRLEITTHYGSTMMSMTASIGNRKGLNMVKKIHRFTHATADEMIDILKDAGRLTPDVKLNCERVYASCGICAKTGRPFIRRKVSLTHVNEAFNEELQADYVVVYIGGDKYDGGEKFEVLNIIDVGTGYGERSIAPSRNAESMKKSLEEVWFCRHGAPKRFSADPEFCKPTLQRFLKGHEITLCDRPSRSSHKNGMIERNNGIFKSILAKIGKENTEASPTTLIARASLLANMLHGNSTLSAFQLARGYAPSIIGMPSSAVPRELMQSHIELTSRRALHKILAARSPRTLPKELLTPGRPVWVFYKTSQQNIPIRWIAATVQEAREHYVLCRRSDKGPPMKIAYEHIRLQPRDDLTRELCEYSLEDELSSIRFDDDFDDTEEVVDPDNSDERILKDIFGSDGESEEEDMEGDHRKEAAAMMGRMSAVGNSELDIGDIVPRGPNAEMEELVSHKSRILEDIYRVIGGEQVTRRKLEFAPPWIVEMADKEELEDNWKETIEEVEEASVPKDANVIGSHFVYKVKNEEGNAKRLKARLCPHGNMDKLKGRIRSDSASVRFDVIRLMLSIATTKGFSLGCADVQGAYLQSGPIGRTIYVRPPLQAARRKGCIWRLLKLPYGIPEAGRQWAKVFEAWLTGEAGLERVPGISQMFIRRGKGGEIKLMVSKVTDDILMAGSAHDLRQFASTMAQEYKLSKVVIDDEIQFNGCTIRKEEDGHTTIDMVEYMDRISQINIDADRYKKQQLKATDKEIEAYRALAGELVWIGYGTLPQAAVVASYMQQKVPTLTVHDLVEANKTLKELKDLRPVIRYLPHKKDANITVCTYSDAAFNISPRQSYGQTGVISGIRIETPGDDPIYHMIDWASSKQRRVSHSSYGAEILACTEADDRGFSIKNSYSSLNPNIKIRHELIVDSKGLYDTISTLHEGRDYRLKQTVQRIRDSFENQDIDTLKWVQGKCNIADALTKRNPEIHRLLNRIATSGRLKLPSHQEFSLDSERWR